jgi:hypothetical protein
MRCLRQADIANRTRTRRKLKLDLNPCCGRLQFPEHHTPRVRKPMRSHQIRRHQGLAAIRAAGNSLMPRNRHVAGLATALKCGSRPAAATAPFKKSLRKTPGPIDSSPSEGADLGDSQRCPHSWTPFIVLPSRSCDAVAVRSPPPSLPLLMFDT